MVCVGVRTLSVVQVGDSAGNTNEQGNVKLLADDNQNLVIATALDHVAELAVDDSFNVMNLSIRDLRELLVEQKTGVAFLVGSDLGNGFHGT
jgi:hypothetical protein